MIRSCYYGYDCYNSAWYNWGRWVVLGAVILGAFLIFFLCACITARRRRRMGYRPYYGTGWTLGRTPPGQGSAQYNPGYYNQNYEAQPYYWNNANQPPPSYPQSQSQPYYARGNDVELQPPQAAYAPPKNPPNEQSR
ncbi:MAG: hypothetical protein FE78DRAFT_72975 [Acidomyces sp. 'richmondensis']|nr:MAG: hypothetical protein FE78DRAFT_72975 [Acidomyces sp. 'richmondensis']